MICEIDGWVLGGMQFGVVLGCWCMCCFGVLVAVRAQFCEIDGRVLRGMQFGVLEEVQFFC